MKNKIEKDLIKSIATSRATEISSQLGEVALDKLLSESIVKDIPIIGSAISLIRAGNDIQAYYFTKKIIKFLTQLEEIPIAERTAFIEKHTQEKDKLEKLGERLLLIINSANDTDIAMYLGKALKLFIQGKISQNDLNIYNHAISNLNPYVIAQLHQCYKVENLVAVDGGVLHFLISLNLLNGNITPFNDNGNLKYSVLPEKNIFGQRFYDYIFE